MYKPLRGRCADCDKVWPEEELCEIHDFWGRVLAGDVMPLGQCPDCEALCYTQRDEDGIVVKVENGVVTDVTGILPGLAVEVRDFDVEQSDRATHETEGGRRYAASAWP